MTNKKDKRNIPLAIAGKKNSYKPLTEADWLDVEARLKQKISQKTRTEITNITRRYSCYLENPPDRIPASEAHHDIQQWIKRTSMLKRKFGRANKKRKSHKELKPEKILLKLLNIASVSDRHRHIDLFVDLLEGVEELGRLYAAMIGDQDRFFERDNELWYIWAALIRTICARANISARHPERRQLEPWFVYLLAKLQMTLVERPQGKSRLKSGESLRKAAIIGFKTAWRHPRAELREIFAAWTKLDIYRFGKGMGGAHNVVRRLERNLYGEGGRSGGI